MGVCRYTTVRTAHILMRFKRYHRSNYRLRFFVLFSFLRSSCFSGQIFFLDVSSRSVCTLPSVWPYHLTLLPSTNANRYRDYFRIRFRFSIPSSELRLVCNFSKTRICQFIYLQMYEIRLFIRRAIVSLCRAGTSSVPRWFCSVH